MVGVVESRCQLVPRNGALPRSFELLGSGLAILTTGQWDIPCMVDAALLDGSLFPVPGPRQRDSVTAVRQLLKGFEVPSCVPFTEKQGQCESPRSRGGIAACWPSGPGWVWKMMFPSAQLDGSCSSFTRLSANHEKRANGEATAKSAGDADVTR